MKNFANIFKCDTSLDIKKCDASAKVSMCNAGVTVKLVRTEIDGQRVLMPWHIISTSKVRESKC